MVKLMEVLHRKGDARTQLPTLAPMIVEFVGRISTQEIREINIWGESMEQENKVLRVNTAGKRP